MVTQARTVISNRGNLPIKFGRNQLAEAKAHAFDYALSLLDSSGGFSGYTAEPINYVREVLGSDVWSMQEDILRAIAEPRARVSVATCNSSGKTWIAAAAASWFLNVESGIVLTTAPTGRQVSELLWREIRHQSSRAKRPLLGKILQREPRWEIDDKWYGLGFATDELERYQGFHAPRVLVIMDEASGVDDIINDAIEGVLSSGDARLLKISNPTQTAGHFYDDFHSKRGLGGRRTFTVSAFDTPCMSAYVRGEYDGSSAIPFSFLISPLFVEEKRLEWGEDSDLWRVKVLGQFPTGALDSVIALSDLERARLTELPVPVNSVEVGVDVARYGEDRTVICVRSGPCVLYLEELTKRSTVFIAGRVTEIANMYASKYQTTPWNVKIKVDDASMGGGVTDQLEAMGHTQVVPINAANRASDPNRYPNRRSELWFAAGDFARSNLLDLTRLTTEQYDKLASELTTPRWKMDLMGRRVVQSKDEIKAKLKRSPDIADAFNLAFAAGVGVRDSWSGTLDDKGRVA